MRYSTRSLMIMVTLVCVVLGARVEYLRRKAAFHTAEEVRITRMMDGSESNLTPLLRHHDLAAQYSLAVYRPWTIVREPSMGSP
ncbi:MAG: hypothetical protein ACKVP0_26125 [Pirellulaceae bacterium]